MKNRLFGAAKTARSRAKNGLKKQSGVRDYKVLSTESALKVIYYMKVADGLAFYSEEEKFDVIGRELDPAFAANRESIIRECRAQLNSNVNSGSYYDVLQDGVEKALLASKPTKESFVTPKLLVWNMLTIAYGEEEFDEDERKLLAFVVRKTNIDATVFHEMENSIQELMDIEKEITQIKTTRKNEMIMEPAESELLDRRNALLDSIQSLISC